MADNEIDKIAEAAARAALHYAFDGRGGRMSNSTVVDRVRGKLREYIAQAYGLGVQDGASAARAEEATRKKAYITGDGEEAQ